MDEDGSLRLGTSVLLSDRYDVKTIMMGGGKVMMTRWGVGVS